MKKEIVSFLCGIFIIMGVICGCTAEKNPEVSAEVSEPTDDTLEVITWVDCLSDFTELEKYASCPAEYVLPEYPDVTFVFDGKLKAAYKDGSSEELPLGSPRNIIFADLTGDGIRDVCVTVFESLTLPPEILAMCMGYKIRVYDPVTKTCGTAENTQTERGSIIFRVENGELYAVSYGGARDTAKFYTDLRFDTENGTIGMDAVDPEQQTKVNLVCSPVVTSRCIYTYNEDHTSIKTYRLLTDELIDRMEAISADITWKEINPVIWSFTDRYFISPLCEVHFEDCVLHVYPGGSVAVLFSDIEYYAEEGGETLADYITTLNEDALPYK
ncbi:MAG: hypothetical protein IKV01_02425 [Clostridia bacterium]|nr:hypothetical protein [Clostridia bacterium]